MDAKLTLKLKEQSISRAKEYVSTIGTSLSSIVEDFFDGLTLNKESSNLNTVRL